MTLPAYALEIITPEGPAFRGLVRKLRLPGMDGSFGILARHAPLIGALGVGLLKMELEDGKTRTFAIGEGFAEVHEKGARILTDFANEPGDIDVERARAAEQRARERLKQRRDSNVDFARAEAALRRAILRLKVTSPE